MKFTETSTQSQAALLSVALAKAFDLFLSEHSDKESKKAILKSIGLTEKEFATLSDMSKAADIVQKQISAVTGVNKEMFHMLRHIEMNDFTTDDIMNNQCGHFPDIKDLLAEVKALGIVDDSILPKKNSFSKRCFIADATFRYNKTHGTKHGMKPLPKGAKKSNLIEPKKFVHMTGKPRKG